MMKTIHFASLLFLAAFSANGEEYEFRVHRFSDIRVHTEKGKGDVEIKIYPKAVDTTEIIFRSPLSQSSQSTWETPSGTIFSISRLNSPVVHDQNRGINSGDCRLVISGTTAEFQNLKNRLIPISTFRTSDPEASEGPQNPATPDMVYYGTEIQKPDKG